MCTGDLENLETYSKVLKLKKIPAMNSTAYDLFFLLGEKSRKALVYARSQGGRTKLRKEELQTKGQEIHMPGPAGINMS